MPDERVPSRHMGGQGHWRRACGCAYEVCEYPATDDDLAAFRRVLAERHLPSSDTSARRILTSLADTGTRVVIVLADGEVVLTADEAIDAIGHGF